MKKDFRNRSFKDSLLFKNKHLFFIIIIFVLLALSFLFILFNNSNTIKDSRIKMVSGTEYISGEQGQVIVRVEDFKGNPINDTECYLSLLYPDKSFFLVDVLMIQTSFPGNYYYSFITPSIPGIYEEYISCNIIEGDVIKTLNLSYSFHVSPGLNLIVDISNNQKAQYDDLINRLDDLDSNFKSYINSVDQRVYSIQTFIDNNISKEISYIKQDVSNINNDLNNSIIGIEGRLNLTIKNNFIDFYTKFKKSYDAMADIFGEE